MGDVDKPKKAKFAGSGGSEGISTTIGVFAIAVVLAVSALVLTLIFRGSSDGASSSGNNSGTGGGGTEVINTIQASSAEIQELTGENLSYDTGNVTFIVSDEVSAASLVVNDTVTFGAPDPAVPRQQLSNFNNDGDDENEDDNDDNAIRRATAAPSVYKIVLPGTQGQAGDVLTTGSIAETNMNMVWEPVAATGVTSIGTTAGELVGGPITSTGTLGLAATGVTPATYGTDTEVSQITVDSFGRVTNVTNVSIASGGVGTVTSVGSGSGLEGGPITGAGSLSLTSTGVSAGSYGDSTNAANFTVDGKGRLTSASAVAIPQGTVTSVTASTGLTGGAFTTSGTIALANTGVTADTYGSSTNIPIITVNSQGQVTTVSTATAPAGTVTSVTAGDGLSGGAITDVGTISLPDVVTANTYGSATQIPQITFDVKGRATGVSLALNPQGTVTLVTGGTGLSGSVTSSGSLDISSTGVTLGSYGGATSAANFTVNAQGQLSAASSVAIPQGTVISIEAGEGLSGGTITGTGTIDITDTIVGSGPTGSATLIPVITYNNKGQLTTVTTASNPQGTVTSVTAGTGLSGGTFTTSGTISLPNTITAGTQGGAASVPIITYDDQGRLTTVTTATTVSSVTAGAGLSGGTITGIGTISMPNTITSATQGGAGSVPIITYDDQGRLTTVTTATTVSSVAAGTGMTGGTITSTGTIGLDASGVDAAVYTSATFAVNTEGQITQAVSGIKLTNFACIYDDFIGGGQPGITQNDGPVWGDTPWYQFTTGNNSGVSEPVSNTTANATAVGELQIRSIANGKPCFLYKVSNMLSLGHGSFSLKFRIAIPSTGNVPTTANDSIGFGLSSVANPATLTTTTPTATNVLFCRAIQGTANWQFVRNNASTAVTTDSTVAVAADDAYHNFLIDWNKADGEVTFSIDDVVVGIPFTTSLPVSTAGLYLFFYVNRSGTSMFANIDFVNFKQVLDVAR